MSRPSASVEHDDTARTFGRKEELEHPGEGVVREISLEWARRLRFAALGPSPAANRLHHLDEVFVARCYGRARFGRIDAGQGWTTAVYEDHDRNVARPGIFLDIRASSEAPGGPVKGDSNMRSGRERWLTTRVMDADFAVRIRKPARLASVRYLSHSFPARSTIKSAGFARKSLSGSRQNSGAPYFDPS